MIAATLVLALAAQDPAPLLVSTEWLAGRLNEPGLVVFHIGDDRIRPTYDAGHIPGAQFLNPWVDISAPRVEGGLSLEMPDTRQLDSVLSARGVSSASRVILYQSDQYFTPVARAFLTLEYAGLGGRISILDGGLERWKAEGRAVSTEVPSPRAAAFTARPRPALVVDAPFVERALGTAGIRLVDARDVRFYEGADTRQGRNGRIPGAVNVPFSTIMEADGRFKDPTTLRQMFATAGVAGGDRVITYCHIGQQASLVWFAARLAGFEAAMYDGSFQDWARRTELPVEPGGGK